jgi:uroporphyrinogen decarboxylase
VARRDDASGADASGLDWTSDPRDARRIAAGRVALQGNLDPRTLFARRSSVRAAARACARCVRPAPGTVFNLGHGILPERRSIRLLRW